ncbi:Aste57867_24734 [Aphanomyces stellatus]|uniref:Aste57867_24734 protein n=1 Tax=Aphanomyces stellatus TaxID=120398 RepID=A0A485LVH4_9STRA|nr:hypothetical protein As57867_024656 [Aphanomyces stellatus]VFU01370.1 Aste57867_24734 [Aphanomyces stellatus]
MNWKRFLRPFQRKKSTAAAPQSPAPFGDKIQHSSKYEQYLERKRIADEASDDVTPQSTPESSPTAHFAVPMMSPLRVPVQIPRMYAFMRSTTVGGKLVPYTRNHVRMKRCSLSYFETIDEEERD